MLPLWCAIVARAKVECRGFRGSRGVRFQVRIGHRIDDLSQPLSTPLYVTTKQYIFGKDARLLGSVVDNILLYMSCSYNLAF